MRSRMLRRPMTRRGSSCTASMSKPVPSSLTSRRTPSFSSKASATCTCCAFACLRTLVSASCVRRKSAVFTSGCSSNASPSIIIDASTAPSSLNSSTSRSSAAGRPRVSSSAGRSRCEMRRTSMSESLSRCSALGSAGGVGWCRLSSDSTADSMSSLADTSVWLVPSCSSRARWPRSSSCDCTTRRASRRSLASAVRCSLRFSSRPAALTTPRHSAAMPAIHSSVAVTLAFICRSSVSMVDWMSSRYRPVPTIQFQRGMAVT